MSDNEEFELSQHKQYCAGCHATVNLTYFSRKRSGNYKKRCDQCLTKGKEYRDRYRCEHGYQKAACKYCKAIKKAQEVIEV